MQREVTGALAGSASAFSTLGLKPELVTATISNAVDYQIAIALLKERVATVPKVLASPPPEVDVLEFTPAGPKLCARPDCRPEYYWDVYFGTNRLIREAFADAGFPAPIPAYSVSGAAAGSPLALSQ